jgi:hypothetical protein
MTSVNETLLTQAALDGELDAADMLDFENRLAGNASLAVGFFNQGFFRRRCSIRWRQGFDVLGYHQRFRPVARKPGEGRVSRDGKKPSTGIAAGIAIEPAQRSQTGFLDNILRICAVPGKPAGQRVGIVEVRHDHRRKMFIRRGLRQEGSLF